EAIIRAGAVRLRPVLLTSITTILGLSPMVTGISFNFKAFSWEFGSESVQWWGPMAVAVTFGLAFATILTLIVVPVMYSIFTSMSEGMKSFVDEFGNDKRGKMTGILPDTIKRKLGINEGNETEALSNTMSGNS